MPLPMHMRHRARRIYEAAERLSIQQRLILSYLLIILLPSVLISVYIFNGFYEKSTKDIIRSNESVLEMEGIHAANNIDKMERTAQLSISDDTVADYLQTRSELSVRELLEYQRVAVPGIERLQNTNPDIVHIRIYSKNPNIMELWPVFFNAGRIADEPWHSQLEGSDISEKWYFYQTDRDPLQDPETAAQIGAMNPKISLIQNIGNGKGAPIGILQIDMPLSRFFPNTFSNTEDGQSQMFVIDRNGQIYTNQAGYLLRVAGMDAAEVTRQFESGRRDGQSSFEFAFNKQPYLGIYSHLEHIDADLVSIVSLNSVLSEIRKTRDRIIVANIALIVLLSLSHYVLNSFILKKLHILSDSMKKVHQGDFNFEIDVKGSGEVGELARHFRKMLKKINEFIAEAVNKEAAAKEAELKTLKNQIDSHFLYNTLENIKMMAEVEGQYPISDALTSLGGMMRYNLSWSSEYTRLKDEIRHIRNYIAITNIRYDNSIILNTDIPSEFLEQEVLKMSLQPIVENAVKHGSGLKLVAGKPFTITIGACRENDTLTIEIVDDGIGMPAGRNGELNGKLALGELEFQRKYGLQESGGIGLRNVHQRIRLHYGADYGLRIVSEEGQYTKVIMRIPTIILSGGYAEHA